jgi:hypothetical protein
MLWFIGHSLLLGFFYFLYMNQLSMFICLLPIIQCLEPQLRFIFTWHGQIWWIPHRVTCRRPVMGMSLVLRPPSFVGMGLAYSHVFFAKPGSNLWCCHSYSAPYKYKVSWLIERISIFKNTFMLLLFYLQILIFFQILITDEHHIKFWRIGKFPPYWRNSSMRFNLMLNLFESF